MKKIYLVLTHTGTNLSKIIKNFTKDEFTHISIALDNNLEEMYSFGRLNPYNAFKGGFVQEHIDSGTFKRFKNTVAKIYYLDVTDKQYEDIKNNIKEIEKERKKYKFNIIGLFAVGFNVKIKKEKYFYCAEFVKYILEKSKVEINLPEIIRPECFKNLDGAKEIYTGLLNKYNKEQIQITKS